MEWSYFHQKWKKKKKKEIHMTLHLHSRLFIHILFFITKMRLGLQFSPFLFFLSFLPMLSFHIRRHYKFCCCCCCFWFFLSAKRPRCSSIIIIWCDTFIYPCERNMQNGFSLHIFGFMLWVMNFIKMHSFRIPAEIKCESSKVISTCEQLMIEYARPAPNDWASNWNGLMGHSTKFHNEHLYLFISNAERLVENSFFFYLINRSLKF